MGNHQNKLDKKCASLPPQEFPSPKREDTSFIRKLVRASKRRKHNNTHHRSVSPHQSPQRGGSEWKVPFTDGLFLPEYPVKGDVEHSDFEVLEMIAKGAFGNVLKVRHVEDKTIYAMKIMKKSRVIVEGAVKQCKDEAVIQSAVGHHPFIVKPYFYFQNRENVYIVMDFVPRGELFAAWRHFQHFGETLVKLYIAELAMVVDFLHRSEIIYRDLKMENILIDIQGHLQVIDFGLAKWLKRGHRTRTICGTLQYIAPEVLNMQPYTHAVDWWSLGILMYTLLTGEYPVNGANNHFDMAEKVNQHVFELPPQVNNEPAFSAEVQQVIQKLLRRNPFDRISTLQQLESEPFFNDLDFDLIINREISPNVYFETQGAYGYNFRDLPISRSTSFGTSIDELNTSRSSSTRRRRNSKFKFTWAESIASLNASFV